MSRFKRTLTFLGFRRPEAAAPKASTPVAVKSAAKPVQTRKTSGDFTGPPDPRDRSVTALVYAIYFTMVGLVGLCLVIVFTWIIREPPSPPPPVCREDLANSCDEGLICRSGVCIPAPDEICNSGDSCDSCTCIFPSSCGADRICRDPSSPAPPRCSADIAAFVEKLVNHQRDCEATAGGKMSSCPTSNVMSFLLHHEQFDALLKEFPSSIVFMFPNGEPALAAQEGLRAGAVWPETDPSGETKKRYVDKLKQQEAVFRAARYIVIVGRASQGGVPGSSAADFGYAQSRVRFARDLVVETLAATDDEKSEMYKKFLEFALGSERRLRLDFYSAHYRRPTAWWSKDAPLELSQALSKLDNNLSVTPKERKQAEEVINRSVAIFAIPNECVVKGQ